MKPGNNTLLLVSGALVIAGAGFFAGRHMGYGRFAGWKNPDAAAYGHMGGGMMRGDFRGQGAVGEKRRGGNGMMGASGEITKIDGKTVTLKYSDGTTADITLSDEATVQTLTAGTVSDLAVGRTVMIRGGGFWSDAQTVIVRP